MIIGDVHTAVMKHLAKRGEELKAESISTEKHDIHLKCVGGYKELGKFERWWKGVLKNLEGDGLDG